MKYLILHRLGSDVVEAEDFEDAVYQGAHGFSDDERCIIGVIRLPEDDSSN